MPLTVPLHPVLQVGVNPPGIKTSFSLPLQQDHSTALVIPHCRDSRALEVHTHSVLSSRITCLPTVCILALMGKKKKKKSTQSSAWRPCLYFFPSFWKLREWMMEAHGTQGASPSTEYCTCASRPSCPLGYSLE